MAGSPTNGTDELTPHERGDIEGLALKLATCTYYQVFRVSENADRKTIRDAYFALSKQFHPDAFYGRNLGRYGPLLDEIFRDLTQAYDTLSNKQQRAEYDLSLGLSPSRTLDPPPALESTADKDALRRTGPRTALVATPTQTPASGQPRDPLRQTGPTAPFRAPSVAPTRETATVETLGSVAHAAMANAPTAEHKPVVSEAVIPPPFRASEATATTRPLEAPVAPATAKSAEEIARAKHAAARKLAGRSSSDPEFRAAKAPSGVSSGTALKAQFAHREDLAVNHKLNALRDTAARLEAHGDIAGAANTLQLAVGLAPDDHELAARFEALQRRAAEIHYAANQKLAGEAERAGDFERALACWQKVLKARPDEFAANLHSGMALLKLQRELPRAAEFARKALAANPRSVDAYVLLAEIFLLADKPASAKRAADEAAKLDPNAITVKDLLTRTR
jgi:curved DNA-binding protein CbpA